VKQSYLRFGLWAGTGLLMLLAAISYAALCAYVYLAPSLPDVAALRDVRLQVPLRVYSRDGRLIAQIGEYRRKPVSYEDVPQQLVQAVLATEDDRFFEHSGVDYMSLVRATANYLVYGQHSQAGGGGTITMQLARNIFFTPEFTYQRKLSEIFLALRIESSFKKQEILTLYLNKIFLGQRAYGVSAAAEVYFGKSLDELTLAETATIAGLPQAPSRDNPIANPERAKLRRAYVLRRMKETDQIEESEYVAALEAPMTARLHGPATEVEAPYVAEMARAEAFDRYGEDIYTAGYKVITTIDSRLQHAANGALRLGLMEYDRRRGYRGPLGQVEIVSATERSTLLGQYPAINLLEPALVIEVGERSARVALADDTELPMEWIGLSWARRASDRGLGPEPKNASEVVSTGDIVYVVRTGTTAQLAQLPLGQSALVALDPQDGAIVALNGGFDYFVSKYNRAIQARRQPGSAFKPFIYSAALENGFTPASVVLDAPVVFDDAANEDTWRPENYSGQFYGPTRLREALTKSRNLVSVRLMRAMGIPYTVDYLSTHFGFPPDSLPRDLTLALGSLQLAPTDLAAGFATFANGGFRIKPYIVERIVDATDKVVYESQPAVVCYECERDVGGRADSLSLLPSSNSAAFLQAADTARAARSMLPPERLAARGISAQNAWLLSDMMHDVVQRGTAQRAKSLNRNDLAGKTGTTNDQFDAWFCGFNAKLVAAAWVGLDEAATLGPGEEGGRTALPSWIYFMREALRGMPQTNLPAPAGLGTVKISPDTGKLASADDPNAIFETFMEGHLPESPDPFDRDADREKSKKEDPLF
jgi:penicillin-binding protein 1A